MGLINKGQLLRFADKLKKNSYGEYLKKVADGE